MRTILLSFDSTVFPRLMSGEKIYEHRKALPEGPLKGYLYVNSPISSIVGIMHLDNKVNIGEWKQKYDYDPIALKRIEKYMEENNVAMEITDFQMTNYIPLQQLRNDLARFIVPRRYYYIDGTPLEDYLLKNIKPTGNLIKHNFENISSDMICTK